MLPLSGRGPQTNSKGATMPSIPFPNDKNAQETVVKIVDFSRKKVDREGSRFDPK